MSNNSGPAPKPAPTNIDRTMLAVSPTTQHKVLMYARATDQTIRQATEEIIDLGCMASGVPTVLSD